MRGYYSDSTRMGMQRGTALVEAAVRVRGRDGRTRQEKSYSDVEGDI